MKDNKRDEVLKEKFQKEKISIPSEINLKINEALLNLPERKKQKRYAKKIAAVAAVMAVSVLSTGLVFPTYAKNIPVIGSVFEYFNDKQYVKYAQGVDQSIVDKGINITVKEIACDDNLLVISYTIESQKKLTIGERSDFNGEILCNGESLDYEWSDNQGKWIDEKTYAGYATYYIAHGKIPEKFNLDIRLRGIEERDEQISGEWFFKFNVSKAEASQNTQTLTPGIVVSLPKAQMEIAKITRSPFDNIIFIKGTFKEAGDDNEPYDFFVLEENGKLVSVETDCRWNDKNFEVDVHFSEDELARNCTLIAYMRKSDSGMDRITSDPLTKFPVVLKRSDVANISVKKLEFTKESTKLYYQVEGLAYNPHNDLFLLDEEGEKIYAKKGTQHKLIDYENQEFVRDFPTLDKDKIYRLATFEQRLEVLKQNQIQLLLE